MHLILMRPLFGGEQLAKQGVTLLLVSLPNGHGDVPARSTAGPSTLTTTALPAEALASLSGARSLSAMPTAVTHLSGREGIRMHIPNKPSSGQVAHITWRPSFFTGRPVLQFGAGMAAGGGSVADRDRSTLRLLNPVIVSAMMPLPSPNTSHTTFACSPALTSLVMLLRRRLLLLLLLVRWHS